jgi:hypothetical protein
MKKISIQLLLLLLWRTDDHVVEVVVLLMR